MGHVSKTTPFLGVICHPFGRLDIVSLCTKFETSNFDRVHMTSYSTLIEITHHLVPFSSYSAFFVKSGQFLPTTPASVAPIGGDPV